MSGSACSLACAGRLLTVTGVCSGLALFFNTYTGRLDLIGLVSISRRSVTNVSGYPTAIKYKGMSNPNTAIAIGICCDCET